MRRLAAHAFWTLGSFDAIVERRAFDGQLREPCAAALLESIVNTRSDGVELQSALLPVDSPGWRAAPVALTRSARASPPRVVCKP